MPSIFSGPSKIISVVQNEANEEYLRATLAESGLPEEEQRMQLRTLLAQKNPTPVVEEKTTASINTPSNATINNSSPKTTIPVVQNEVNEQYLEEFMTNAGFTEDEKKAYRRQAIEVNGLQIVTPEKTTTITNNSSTNNNNSPKTIISVVQNEVNEEYLRTMLAESGLSEAEQKRQLSALLAQMNPTPLAEQNVPNNNSPQNSTASTLSTEFLTSTLTELGLNAKEAEEAMSGLRPQMTSIVEEKTAITNPSFISNIAQEIGTLKGIISILSPEEWRNKGQLQARLTKLEIAQNEGVTVIESEAHLDSFRMKDTTSVMRLREPATVTTPTFYVEQEIDEFENEVLPFLLTDGTAQQLQEANRRLAKLKTARTRGITTYSDEASL